MAKNRFSADILAWYDQNKRALPWRTNKNPYSIWLSEIILQQTRVAQGLPYYNRFIENYPSVNDLASAAESDVLRLWQGLGYYSRARNLHKCAKLIVEEHSGKFPESMEELKKLPGIGNYTAAAIASLAFNEAVPVVDGNVYRLLARYFAIQTDISSSKAYNEFFAIASEHLDKSRPGDFNQAMMEFGAIQCAPKQPACDTCPLQDSCAAYAMNLQADLPVKLGKTKVRQRFFHYLLVRADNRILMQERRKRDIWHGLFDFPLVETAEQVDFEQIEHPLLDQIGRNEIVLQVEDKIHRHVLSHQVLNVNFVTIEIRRSDADSLDIGDFQWFDIEEVERLPKPVLIVNYLDSYLKSIHLQEEKN